MNSTIEIARSRLPVGILLVLLVAFAGCGGDDDTAQQATPGGGAADAHDHAGHDHAGEAAHPAGGVTIAGVTFDVPAGWRDLGASGMRQAQFRHGPVAGDTAEGEVNVFYFGPTSGGGVEANLTRWIGQMVLPDGGDPATAAERSTFTADGMPGHVVALNGGYKSGGGRPMGSGMGGGGEILEGYRLVGVVIEGPEGSIFFKLTGPEASARAMEGDLLTMVKSAHK
jgi:hypothetical protein